MKNESYEEFVEKFVPKKTTDDCYTPENVYEAVKTWAVKEYNLEGKTVVRPFYPGGDYLHEKYPENCVVIDNPPFSIITQICRDYDRMGVPYFLFAPSLTLFCINRGKEKYVIADANITYENGVIVRTGFVTNLGEYKIITAPDLHDLLEKCKPQKKELPKYRLPGNVTTAATLQKIAGKAELRIREEDAEWVPKLDSMREAKKGLFGSGFILSEKAAAEKAAAEKAAAEKAAAEKAAAEKAAEKEKIEWKLSEREKEIIARLSKGGEC